MNIRTVVFVNLLPLPINPSIDNHVQGVLFLRDGSESLMYAYLESRTAYFMPGGILLWNLRTEKRKGIRIQVRWLYRLLLYMTLTRQGSENNCKLIVRNYFTENCYEQKLTTI